MWIAIACKVVLFGHRDFCGHRILDERLCPLLKELVRTKPFVEIYIGRNGEFDMYAAAIVKQIQAEMGKANNELICVLPYPIKNIEYYREYYDSIIIPACIEKSHPKGAFTQRNRWMVEESDLFVCYVERTKGGAYTALEYARKLKKSIINLATREH